MRNRLATHLSNSGRRSGGAAPVRLKLLTAVIGTALLVIGGRVAHLQFVTADRFMVPWDDTTAVMESIPANNGRIVSSDGVVLAFDRTRFDLSVHYRWLEEPPNARWLTQQARLRLSPRDRRQRELVKQAEQQVLESRAELWRALAKQTGVSEEDLARRRLAIQTRVERMSKNVVQRRQAVSSEGVEKGGDAQEDGLSVSRLWQLVFSELTTPPSRERTEPLVLKEELEYHPLLTDLPLAAAAAVEAAPNTFPLAAVAIQHRSERVYPGHDLAAHVIGVRRSTTAAAVGAGTTRRGESGVEQSYDATLRGQDGVRRVVYNRRREVIDTVVLQAPVDGRDVTLSIVATVQKQAERILDEALAVKDAVGDDTPASAPRGGTIVAVDVQTGDLITAACAPRFDLNLFNEFEKERWQALRDDPRRPFFPRVTALTAPPGSVFKVLTAVAALEENAIDPEQPLYCQGYLNRPDQLRCMIFRQRGASHGDVTLSDALCESCNVYFFQAAQKMGRDPLRKWSERFGFGAPTGADLPGEVGGQLPAGMARSGRRVKEDGDGTALQMAIGQSSLMVSPLQVARMMAAIANGGSLVSPRFAHAAPLANSAEIQQAGFDSPAPSSRTDLHLSPRTLAVVRESLERVVSDPRGTGRSASVEGISIAGKTGTAEMGGGQPDHAWFAGYAPAQRPRVAFVVMLEHAGSGGQTAGRVVKKLVEAMADAGVLRKEFRGHTPEVSE